MTTVRSTKIESFLKIKIDFRLLMNESLQKHEAEKGKRMCVGKPEKTVYKPLATLRVPL